MKKYLLMLIAVGMSLSFAGCNSSSSNTSSKSSGNNAESSASSSDKSSSSDTNSSASTDSDKTVEHKVGETIDIEGKKLTIKAVTKDYKSGNEFLKPGAGNQYIKVDLNIKNDTGNAIDVSSYEFKILDSNGVYHNTNYILKDQIVSTKIANGGTLSGSISFEVPKNDNDLKLIYTPSLWSDDHVEIKI